MVCLWFVYKKLFKKISKSLKVGCYRYIVIIKLGNNFSLLLSTLEPVQIAHSKSLLLTFDCNKWLFEVLVSYQAIFLSDHSPLTSARHIRPKKCC